MQTSSRSIYRFFQRNISFVVFNAYLICLFALLLQEYHNELLGMSCTCALVSVCTPHCRTSICAAFHSHIFVHYRICFKTVFLCTSVLCGVFYCLNVCVPCTCVVAHIKTICPSLHSAYYNVVCCMTNVFLNWYLFQQFFSG